MSKLAMFLLTLAFSAVLAPSAWAQAADRETLVGARLGAYLDAENLALGGELLTPLAERFYFNPNLEYVFVDNANFATFNFDFHYDFPLRGGDNFFWAGAGLGVLYRDPDGPRESETDLGANFLVGFGFARGPLIPYFQAKLIAADNSDFTVAFGLRF